jgi:hypothetical protein
VGAEQAEGDMRGTFAMGHLESHRGGLVLSWLVVDIGSNARVY